LAKSRNPAGNPKKNLCLFSPHLESWRIKYEIQTSNDVPRCRPDGRHCAGRSGDLDGAAATASRRGRHGPGAFSGNGLGAGLLQRREGSLCVGERQMGETASPRNGVGAPAMGGRAPRRIPVCCGPLALNRRRFFSNAVELAFNGCSGRVHWL
jgi:hypothetical protein